MPVLGVFLKPITEEFGWSRSLFTGALTLGTLLGGVLAIGIGPMIDRYGGRWILTISIIIVGSALILTSRINALWQFYLLQIIARMVGMGVIMLSLQVIIPKWFIAKRGRAVAIGQVGLTLGNVVTPLYAQLLVRVADWRAAAATAGGVMLALSILPTAILLRRRPEDRTAPGRCLVGERRKPAARIVSDAPPTEVGGLTLGAAGGQAPLFLPARTIVPNCDARRSWNVPAPDRVPHRSGPVGGGCRDGDGSRDGQCRSGLHRIRVLSPNPPKGGRRGSVLKWQEGAPVNLG